MSIEVDSAARTENAPQHSCTSVQAYIEAMWIRAKVPLREHEVVRVVKLDMPYYHIWRVDCLERARGLTPFTYVIIVYEHRETHDLHIAVSEQEEKADEHDK